MKSYHAHGTTQKSNGRKKHENAQKNTGSRSPSRGFLCFLWPLSFGDEIPKP
jgi:hypothetical protein